MITRGLADEIPILRTTKESRKHCAHSKSKKNLALQIRMAVNDSEVCARMLEPLRWCSRYKSIQGARDSTERRRTEGRMLQQSWATAARRESRLRFLIPCRTEWENV